MEKRASIKAHFPRSVSIAEYRKTMGCAAKLEKGALLIGTFGDFGFLEGSTSMNLLVLVPPKISVERRAGLIFTRDPRRYSLTLRATGYEKP